MYSKLLACKAWETFFICTKHDCPFEVRMTTNCTWHGHLQLLKKLLYSPFCFRSWVSGYGNVTNSLQVGSWVSDEFFLLELWLLAAPAIDGRIAAIGFIWIKLCLYLKTRLPNLSATLLLYRELPRGKLPWELALWCGGAVHKNYCWSFPHLFQVSYKTNSLESSPTYQVWDIPILIVLFLQPVQEYKLYVWTGFNCRTIEHVQDTECWHVLYTSFAFPEY